MFQAYFPIVRQFYPKYLCQVMHIIITLCSVCYRVPLLYIFFLKWGGSPKCPSVDACLRSPRESLQLVLRERMRVTGLRASSFPDKNEALMCGQSWVEAVRLPC